jgi:hypothetical protein
MSTRFTSAVRLIGPLAVVVLAIGLGAAPAGAAVPVAGQSPGSQAVVPMNQHFAGSVVPLSDPCGRFTNWAGRVYYNVCSTRWLEIHVITWYATYSNHDVYCFSPGTHYLGWPGLGGVIAIDAYWDGVRC